MTEPTTAEGPPTAAELLDLIAQATEQLRAMIEHPDESTAPAVETDLGKLGARMFGGAR